MKDKEKIETLKKCFEDTIWMSVRYAHGRHTYAPSIVRNAISNFKKVFPDFKLREDLTIKPPENDDVGSYIAIKSDYLNDLFEE